MTAPMTLRETRERLICAVIAAKMYRHERRFFALLKTKMAACVARTRCSLLELSHDELGVIIDGLVNPLEPIVLVAFSSTCKGLRMPLGATLEVLARQYGRVMKELFFTDHRPTWNIEGHVHDDRAIRRSGDDDQAYVRTPSFCRELRETRVLKSTGYFSIDSKDLAMMGELLLGKRLPMLESLELGIHFGVPSPPYSAAWQELCDDYDSGLFDILDAVLDLPTLDTGLKVLCESLGCGDLPALSNLQLSNRRVGSAGTRALAGALRRGAMPKLTRIFLGGEALDSEALAELAAALRDRQSLVTLSLDDCRIGDAGIISFLANVGKDDFKNLEHFHLWQNDLSKVGSTALIAAIEAGVLPALVDIAGIGTSTGIEVSDVQWAEQRAPIMVALRERELI